MWGDDPPYLAVGTEVSAKYKGAFCEAKIRKVVRSVKCKVIYKQGLGGATVTDDQIRGTLRAGSVIEVKHPEKKEFVEANITKIQDCSQYTVVFDDGDITTLRRSALCLKSGRHFAESETLDQLPLTHPEHFSNPVIGGRRGRRNRNGVEESSDEDEPSRRGRCSRDEKEADIGRVVCVEGGDKKKQKDNWFPGLVVAPTAQDTVRIHVKDEYLVRSFKDGRYYTVPKKEATEFTREIGLKVDNHTLRAAVEKALMFLDRDELPPHWDRELLFGLVETTATDSEPGFESDSSDDEPREEKDHFVAQLYKFMDDRGTPINKGPTISSQHVDLYRLFKVVHNLGGYNRVTNHNHWKTVSHKIGFGQNPVTVNLVKHAYKKFLHSFEEFYRKLGCTMVNHPRINRNRNKTGRSLIRDRDRATPVNNIKNEQRDKGTEKEEELVMPNLPDEQSITDVKVKIEIEDATTARDLLKDSQRTKSTDTKDKALGKRLDPITLVKVKEERPEESDKIIADTTKEVPKKTKTRKNQSKFVASEPKKSDAIKDSLPKEKKKRLFSRITGKKDKVTKVNKPSSLTSTRQKRTMKDRMKAIVDKLKLKMNKDLTPFSLQESSDKLGQGAKLKIKEEIGSASVKSKKDDTLVSGLVSDEKKKVGRKRKDRQEGIEDVLDILPTYKTICVGDKLKVYYGPTHESKVTYEAKVLSIRREGCDVMYFVHYTGWNTRYDEWIKYSRIADNLSWTPGRLPKKQNLSPKSGKRKCSNGKGESGGRSTPSSVTSTSSKTKTRSIQKSKSSVSGSEVDYDSENTDVEHPSGSKQRTEKYQEEVRREDDLHDDNVADSLNEKKRGKRKIDDDDRKAEKKKIEDIVKIEAVEDCENELTYIGKDSKKSMENKIETEDSIIIAGDKIKSCSVRRKSDEIIALVVESDGLKVSLDNLKVETDIEIDNEEKNKGKKKSEKSSIDICDDTPRKRKSLDKKVDNEVKVESDDSYTQEDEAQKVKSDKECYKKKKMEMSEDSRCMGRDFDLNQIRSELKGIDKTIKVAVGLLQDHKGEENDSIKNEIELPEHFDTEDVYEFKEPEPFCFEARKACDDKSKHSRRSLGRMLDEIQGSPSKKKCKEPTSSPILIESKSNILLSEQEKDVLVVSASNISHLEPCEETFDKICASPLRAATEEPCAEIKLFNDLPAEDDDELDEDSEDRLVISEHESDSEALFTHQYRNHEEIFPTEIRSIPTSDETVRFTEYNSKISSDICLENKDTFPKEGNEEDDDDDEDEDDDYADDTESDVIINDVIQRVISQDMTDESNEEDLLSAPTSPKVEHSDIETDTKSKVCDMIISVEAEEVSSVEPTITEINDLNLKLDTQTDNFDTPTTDAPEQTLDDYDEQKEPVVTTLEPKELTISEEDEKQCENEFEITETVLGSGDTNLIETVDTIEISKEDNSGGNLVSLLCEETIPGSPTPQVETMDCIDEKTEEIVTGASFNDENLNLPEVSVPPSIVQVQDSPVKEAAPVMDNTPPTTPESPISSESVSPRGDRSGSSPPLDNESTKSHRDSEPEIESYPEPKDNTDDESRPEENVTKVDNSSRMSAKKGRRTRKRSEDTGKRKFPRRHHGSDSDDTSENSVTASNRLDVPTRPSRPCKYNFIVQFGPETDANQRITVLTQALQDLRKTYANVKAELASIDRRRKKLRKRERESALNRLH